MGDWLSGGEAELVERPGPDAQIAATLGEISGAARSGGQASQPDLLTEVPINPEEARMAEALWSEEQAVEFDRDTPTAPVRKRDARQLRCSFCQAELGEDIELTPSRRGKNDQRTSSSFCSTHCRDCVLALVALHPSPLASSDFIARRGLVTDRLLDLWRHGQGPDPALVLQAARAASTGLASAETV